MTGVSLHSNISRGCPSSTFKGNAHTNLPRSKPILSERIRCSTLEDRPPGTPTGAEKGRGRGERPRNRGPAALFTAQGQTQETIPAPALAGVEEPRSPGGGTSRLHRSAPPTSARPLPAQVPDSRCTRGPCRGTAALARIALRSQPLPYSAQHDWGGGVSGPGEDERGGGRRRRRPPSTRTQPKSLSSLPVTETQGNLGLRVCRRAPRP